MATCISHSPAETAALGEAWGREAERGLVIGLSGDLGAGKTQLVKGLARGLGITEPVRSPTFALVNIYSGGRLTLFHLDLYRLETREQIIAAGLEDYLQPEGVTVIEWAERWLDAPAPQPTHHEPRNTQHATRPAEDTPPLAPPDRVRIARIEVLSERERRISYEDSRR
ncbi:MAG TPA: tRNA (adenosine(37)-N6)-threonylcarbamoyltransferase complex ATPase subunit type 1 TsaE [Candidatus Acidoferrum sp.]|nr:tRNA (adenosine(37)-N6)-threonylcarbamoyltransferase complex ATPase subunit type 1 TsaE [Candidatus Acidoferrum sp.]